jgi:hypothetical protein
MAGVTIHEDELGPGLEALRLAGREGGVAGWFGLAGGAHVV